MTARFSPQDSYIKQFEFVRIFFAVFVFIRTYYDLEPLWFFALNPEVAYILAYTKMILAIMIVIGFITPVTLFLLLCIQLLDRWFLGAFTLGEVLAHATNVILLLGTAGAYYSLDNKIMSSSNKTLFKNILLFIYNIVGRPVNRKINRIRMLGSYTYGFAVFAAGVIHLYSSEWMSGRSIIEMYSSHYNSKFGDFFTDLFILLGIYTYPLILILTWVLTLWNLTFIIGISFKWSKKYFIYFGLLFHIFALLLMNLGWLIPFTLLLYILIYFPLTIVNKMDIIYDDNCGFCEKSIRILSFLDLFNRLNILGNSEVKSLNNQEKVDKVLTHPYFNIEILGLNQNNNILYGADLYLQIFIRVDLLKIFLPLYYILYKLRLADLLYKYIAKRRLLISSVCRLESSNKNVILELKESNVYYLVLIPWSIWLGLTYITFIYFNIFQKEYISIGKVVPYGSYVDKVFAVTRPNVFNKNDTNSQQAWIEIIDRDNKLIPFYGKKGERLELHESRVAYFNTIKYRRQLGQGILENHDELAKKIIGFYEYKYGIHNTSYTVLYSYRPSYLIECNQDIVFKDIKKLKIMTCYSTKKDIQCQKSSSPKTIKHFLNLDESLNSPNGLLRGN